MGIPVLYPKQKTSIANKEHIKYPYLPEAYKNSDGQVNVEQPNDEIKKTLDLVLTKGDSLRVMYNNVGLHKIVIVLC